MKTAQRIRSMDVLFRKVDRGLVRVRSSRKRRSLALAVLTCCRAARVLQRKKASRSSRSLRREETAFGSGAVDLRRVPCVALQDHAPLQSGYLACISFTTQTPVAGRPVIVRFAVASGCF